MFEQIRIERQDSVTRAADKIITASNTFAERAKALQTQIHDVAGTLPWGDDLTGETFHGEYTKIPEGKDKPFNEVIDGYLETAGKELTRVSNEIADGMVTYEATDLIGSKKVAKSIEEM